MAAILALENISKSFGALKVTDGITLSVTEGETLGILGPNGAGKTTLFNLISGDFHADSGRVLFRGEDVTFQPPHIRCRSGIGRSYQIPQPFGAMTVFENLVAAASFGTGTAEKGTYPRAVDILRETGLLAKANRLAGSLTLLDRKRLELARALASIETEKQNRQSPKSDLNPRDLRSANRSHTRGTALFSDCRTTDSSLAESGL